jgi:heme-degrading monooxygenase HmoA
MVRVAVEHFAKSKGDAEKIMDIILHLRNEAIKCKGYITGETLIDIEQPRSILVISTWDKTENWQAWDQSELRTTITRQMLPLLEVPYSVSIYNFATARVGRVASIF